MPRWYYEQPPAAADPTEQWVAERLDRLGDGWWIRWGFFYSATGDPRARDREGDFVVLGPDGRVLVLEVKGGNLAHFPPTGHWQGDLNHPFGQLHAEWQAVLGWLQEEAEGATLPYVGRALCLPKVPLGSQKDLRDRFGGDFLVFAQDLEDFPGWWGRHMARHPQYCRDPEGMFRRAVVPGLERRAVRDFLRRTDKLFQRYAREQGELLDLVAGNRQLLVEGGAGTGKTFLAVEQACRWAEGDGEEAESREGRRVLFLVYHLALLEAVRELLAAHPLARGSVEVRGWQEWMEGILAARGLDPEMPAEREDWAEYFREVLPDLVRECLAEPPEEFRYDALVVDEAQDHDTASAHALEDGEGPGWWSWYFRTLREGAGARMALFYDGGQRPLFRTEGEFSAERLRAALPRGVHLRLRRNLRYTRPILAYLQSLQAPGTEALREGVVPHAQAPEGPAVRVVRGVPPDATATAVADLLREWREQGICEPGEVLVVGPHRFENSSLAEGAGPAEPDLPSVQSWAGGGVDGDPGGGAPAGPRYLNAYRAKGCESLAVIVVDYAPFATLAAEEKAAEAEGGEGGATEGFFLAATRARQVLAVVERA